MKQAPREAGAGKFVLGGRVAGDRIGNFAAQLVLTGAESGKDAVDQVERVAKSIVH
jgi:hypothetical protein